jgi:hypothetical protein
VVVSDGLITGPTQPLPLIQPTRFYFKILKMDGVQQIKIACLGICLYTASLMAARTWMPLPKAASIQSQATVKVKVQGTGTPAIYTGKKSDQSSELSKL